MEFQYHKNGFPKHFTFAEMTATNTRFGNAPSTWAQVEAIRETAYFLDRIRERFGGPIRVNSGFRSKAVNAAVNGSKTSAHLEGRAADIRAASGKECDNRRLLKILIGEIRLIDQLIIYHEMAGVESSPIRFIHVGLPEAEKKPRMQVMEK